MSELRISTEKVCFIVARSRAFHAQLPTVLPDEGSNSIDDDGGQILEDDEDDDVAEEELRDAFRSLDGAEMADLIGLFWLAREDGGEDDWPDIMAEVADQHPEHPIDYLVEQPLLADFLEEGLAAFGLRCADSGEPIAGGSRLRPD